MIEDCEVRDFHSAHGSYYTAIMATVLNVPPNPTNNVRVVEVRHCQVYGSNLEIGLGTANSAGITFRDNVVAGVDRGLNIDTRAVRYVDLVNNVFLDVNLMANFGAAAQGPESGVFRDFAVVGNAVRLESVPLYQNYRGYEWQAVTNCSVTNWLPVSTAMLAAGRWATGYCAGLLTAGADHITFASNRFTTRPLDGFFEPDPTNTARARWRPLWRPAYHPSTGEPCYHGANTTLADVRLSTRAMDFVNSATLTDPTAELYALDQLPVEGFQPAGRIGRVEPSFVYDRLDEVFEIQVSAPVLSNNQVHVRARVVHHSPVVDSGALPNVPLRLWVKSGPHANTNVVGVWSNGLAHFSYPVGAGTQGRDVLVVYVPIGSGGTPPGFSRWESAWTEVEIAHGQTVRFERIADAADDRRLIPGHLRLSRSDPAGQLTVKVVPVTNLGGLRLARPGGSGDYHLRTNHVTSTNTWYYKAPEADGSWHLVFPAGQREILVQVLPVNSATNRHWIEQEMAVFQLEPLNNAYAVDPPGPHATPGPVDNSVAVTLWDGPKYWMYDLWAYFYYECGGQSQGAGFSGAEGDEFWMDESGVLREGVVLPEGETTEAGATGPAPPGWIQTRTGEWIAVETDPLSAEPAWEKEAEWSLAQALALAGMEEMSPEAGLNSGACAFWGPGNNAYGINNLNRPVIAGSALDSYTGVQLGGSWQAPDYGAFQPVMNSWPYGLMRDVNEAGNLVGTIGGRACYVGGSYAYYLSRFTANEFASEAFALSDGSHAAGWARSNNVARAARWNLLNFNQPPTDLDPDNPGLPGYAYGVNSNGVTVGMVQRTNSNGSYWRAFRWNGSLEELNLPSIPPGTGITLRHNKANDVTASGHALGATDAMIVRGPGNTNVETRACVWWGMSNAPVTLGTIEPRAANPWHQPGRSEALGAVELGSPNKLLVVGTGWITPTGCSRAFRQEVARDPDSGNTIAQEAFNLNDAMWSVIPAGWTLITAEDVNGQEWIVGLATDGAGQSRGYVLVPQGYVSP